MKFQFSKVNAAAGLALAVLTGVASPAAAIDYKSVAAAAILYDVPSQKGKKLFVVRRLTPVEVVVALEGWVKVRDAEGALAWIERSALSDARTLIVTASKGVVRKSPDPAATVLFELERNVAIELVSERRDGWVEVRHADGESGFMRVNQIWGL